VKYLLPINPTYLDLLEKFTAPFTPLGAEINWNWRSFMDFIGEVEKMNLGLNVTFLVGHSTVRIAVTGFETRELIREEMKKMKDMVRR